MNFSGRKRLVVLAALAGAVGCKDPEGAPPAAPAPARETVKPAAAAPAAPREGEGCTELPFADSAPIAEASGAIWLAAEGKDPASILLVGDSGTRGAFLRIDAETGDVLEKGTLALGGPASDDLEGLSRVGDTFYAITSSGFLRSWKRRDGKLAQVDKAYSIGSEKDGTACDDGRGINCGPNYEGLCLDVDGEPSEGCVGFAASKARGTLVCLERDGERFRADPKRSIEISRKETLTGCDIADDEVAYTGANLFGASAVHRVDGWRDPGTAKVTLVGALGVGFPEAIAVAPGGIIYRFSDTGGAPSLMKKYQCGPPAGEDAK
jgi:hypothetical protein